MEYQRKTRQRTTEKETNSEIIDDEFDLSFPKFDFSTAPYLLTIDHQRLLLEEFAYLTVGADVVVLISDVDAAFESIWKPLLTAAYSCGICFKRSIFNGKNYYSVPMRVSSTPEREKMIDGSLTKVEIIDLLGPRGGGGVVLNPLHPEGSAGIVVNYTHVFDKCHTFQVWQEGDFSSKLSTSTVVNYRRSK